MPPEKNQFHNMPPAQLPPIPKADAELEEFLRAAVQWLNALHLQQEQLLAHAAAMRSMLQFFVILVVLGLLVQGCQVFLAFLS